MTRAARRFAIFLPAVAAASALVLGAPPARGQAPPPSVRLVAASEQVTLYRYGRSVELELGVWIAAVGGDFELRVSRPDYDSARRIEQVDAETGAVIRSLPANVLEGWRGLTRFLQVSVRDSSGRRVAWRRFPFCPNGFAQERLNDLGPPLPTYPPSCGSSSPFTKGMIWGVSEGWAANALGGSEAYEDYGGGPYPGGGVESSFRIPNGRYSVTVRIMPRYATLFAVRPEDATVTVRVNVKRPRREGTPRTASRARSAAAPAPAPAGSVPTITDPDPSTLPDLVSLPAWSIELLRRRGREFLAFAVSPWNAGPAPLVVEGFRRPGDDVMDAYQYFFDAQGTVVGRAPVGTMAYDPRRGHEHWHFRQFAAFTLVDASGGEVVRSKKQAFCLVPTDAIDLTVAGADWTPWSFSLASACGGPRSIWVREDLDAGWADTYYQGSPGQSFDVTDLPNGRYEIRVLVNPLGRLYERTTTNDHEVRTVFLRGRPGSRRVTVVPWHTIRR